MKKMCVDYEIMKNNWRES